MNSPKSYPLLTWWIRSNSFEFVPGFFCKKNGWLFEMSILQFETHPNGLRFLGAENFWGWSPGTNGLRWLFEKHTTRWYPKSKTRTVKSDPIWFYNWFYKLVWFCDWVCHGGQTWLPHLFRGVQVWILSLHTLCNFCESSSWQARYDRLMRSAIVIQSGGRKMPMMVWTQGVPYSGLQGCKTRSRGLWFGTQVLFPLFWGLYPLCPTVGR